MNSTNLLPLVYQSPNRPLSRIHLLDRSIAWTEQQASTQSKAQKVALLLHRKGTILDRMGRLDEAEAAFGMAVKKAPIFSLSHAALSKIAERRNDYTAAKAHLDKAIGMAEAVGEPDDPHDLSNLSICYRLRAIAEAHLGEAHRTQ